MNGKRTILALALHVAFAAGFFAFGSVGARAQGFASLAQDADGFKTVTPGRAFSFPADHAPHDGYRIEWWYLTANLTDAEGRAYGAQWTLFRAKLAGGGEDKESSTAGDTWSSPYLFMAHAALTSEDSHTHAERFARAGLGQAGVTTAPFSAYIDDWRFEQTSESGLNAARVVARGDDFSYDLSIKTDAAPVLQGEAGYSLKALSGQASYYYSQPFFTLTGAITLDGKEIPVTGNAWMDREWSSQLLSKTQTGWDWFSLHLDTGEKVMAFRLRDTAVDAYVSGGWINADGAPEPLTGKAIEITPLNPPRKNAAGAPTRWRITIPSKDLSIEATALNQRSWMRTSFPYWEGPIKLSGSHGGVGYLEMTGYTAPAEKRRAQR